MLIELKPNICESVGVKLQNIICWSSFSFDVYVHSTGVLDSKELPLHMRKNTHTYICDT